MPTSAQTSSTQLNGVANHLLENLDMIQPIAEKCEYSAQFFELLFDYFYANDRHSELIRWAAKREPNLKEICIAKRQRHLSILSGLLSSLSFCPSRKSLQTTCYDPIVLRLADIAQASRDFPATDEDYDILGDIFEDFFQGVIQKRHMIPLRSRQAHLDVIAEWTTTLGHENAVANFVRWKIEIIAHAWEDFGALTYLPQYELTRIAAIPGVKKSLDILVKTMYQLAAADDFESSAPHYSILNKLSVRLRPITTEVGEKIANMEEVQALQEMLDANMDVKYKESRKDLIDSYLSSLTKEALSEIESDLAFEADVKWALDTFNSSNGWNLALQSRGIEVWRDPNKTQLVRVKQRVKASFDEFVKRTEKDHLFEFLHPVEVEEIEMRGPYLVARSLTRVPLLKTREMIWERRHTMRGKCAIFVIESTTHPKYPESKRYIRAPYRKHYFVIEDVGNDEVEMMKVISWDLGSSVPTFFLPGPETSIKHMKKLRKSFLQPRSTNPLLRRLPVPA